MSVRPLYVVTKIRISVEMPKKGGVFKAIGADSRRAGSDEGIMERNELLCNKHATNVVSEGTIVVRNSLRGCVHIETISLVRSI